jgi:hypothetical protein
MNTVHQLNLGEWISQRIDEFSIETFQNKIL